MSASPNPTSSANGNSGGDTQPGPSQDAAAGSQNCKTKTIHVFFGGNNWYKPFDFKLLLENNGSDDDENKMDIRNNNVTVNLPALPQAEPVPAFPAASTMIKCGRDYTVIPINAIRANPAILAQINAANNAANNALACMMAGTTVAAASLWFSARPPCSGPSLGEMSNGRIQSLSYGLLRGVGVVSGIVGGIALIAYGHSSGTARFAKTRA